MAADVTTTSEKREQRHSLADFEETRSFAHRFARKLGPGDVVALSGELGAGKTAFVRCIVEAFGDASQVSSPTFTLLNIYELPEFPVYHFDFYRLNGAEDALAMGADEYIESTGLTLIEWPERAPQLVPDRAWRIELKLPARDEPRETRHIILR